MYKIPENQEQLQEASNRKDDTLTLVENINLGHNS